MKHRIVMAALAGLAAATFAAAQSWVVQRSGTTETLNAVWFVDPNRGIAVGDRGTALRTDDGGASWQPIDMGNEDLNAIAFDGPANGLVVGDNGKVFRSPDGGNSWEEVQSGVSANLRACASGMGGRMYAAGENGIIIASMDGGTSWTVSDSTGNRYEGMSAMMDMNAWAVGRGGAIRATRDGGIGWESQSSGTTRDLKAVQFATPTDGYAVGQSNTIIRTSDGGQTWASRNSGANGSFDGVSFPAPSEGWVVGDSGVIFHTMDEGATWRRETSGVTVDLKAVSFTDPSNGWAVGAQGTILKRIIGGLAEQRRAPVARIEARPNPITRFGAVTVIGVGSARVSVVAADGRVVRELGTGQRLSWDASDGSGRRVAPGVYYYVAQTEAGRWTAPVVVSR